MAKVDPFEKLLRVILNSYGLNCRGIKDFLSGAKENNYQIIGIVTYAEVKKLKPQKCDCLLFKTEYVDQYGKESTYGYIYYPLSSKELLMVSYYC